MKMTVLKIAVYEEDIPQIHLAKKEEYDRWSHPDALKNFAYLDRILEVDISSMSLDLLSEMNAEFGINV